MVRTLKHFIGVYIYLLITVTLSLVEMHMITVLFANMQIHLPFGPQPRIWAQGCVLIEITEEI